MDPSFDFMLAFAAIQTGAILLVSMIHETKLEVKLCEWLGKLLASVIKLLT